MNYFIMDICNLLTRFEFHYEFNNFKKGTDFLLLSTRKRQPLAHLKQARFDTSEIPQYQTVSFKSLPIIVNQILNNCYVFLFENKTTDNCLCFKKIKCFHHKLNKIVNFEENLRHSARLQSQAFKVYVRGVQTFLVIRPNFKENSMTGRKKNQHKSLSLFFSFQGYGTQFKVFFLQNYAQNLVSSIAQSAFFPICKFNGLSC